MWTGKARLEFRNTFGRVFLFEWLASRILAILTANKNMLSDEIERISSTYQIELHRNYEPILSLCTCVLCMVFNGHTPYRSLNWDGVINIWVHVLRIKYHHRIPCRWMQVCVWYATRKRTYTLIGNIIRSFHLWSSSGYSSLLLHLACIKFYRCSSI